MYWKLLSFNTHNLKTEWKYVLISVQLKSLLSDYVLIKDDLFVFFYFNYFVFILWLQMFKWWRVSQSCYSEETCLDEGKVSPLPLLSQMPSPISLVSHISLGICISLGDELNKKCEMSKLKSLLSSHMHALTYVGFNYW